MTKADDKAKHYARVRKELNHAQRQADWFRDKLLTTGRKDLFERPYQESRARYERCLEELAGLEQPQER